MDRPTAPHAPGDEKQGVVDPGGIVAARMAGELDGDFVVLLIGMRANQPWKIWRWAPVALAMRAMLKELEADPEAGLLWHSGLGRIIVQYWRSFDHLEAYAREAGRLHRPAWAKFNRTFRDAREEVGIWHETYLVSGGRYEAVYSGMPPFGLAAAGRRVPATGARDGSRGRLSA
ncbi:MAG: DUF4188 domain-containing protein [Pseudomonadota bacterium]